MFSKASYDVHTVFRNRFISVVRSVFKSSSLLYIFVYCVIFIILYRTRCSARVIIRHTPPPTIRVLAAGTTDLFADCRTYSAIYKKKKIIQSVHSAGSIVARSGLGLATMSRRIYLKISRYTFWQNKYDGVSIRVSQLYPRAAKKRLNGSADILFSC